MTTAVLTKLKSRYIIKFSSKGQIVIPKEVCEKFFIENNTKLVLHLMIPKKPRPIYKIHINLRWERLVNF